MKFFDRLKGWARALEDIEDPTRSELRRLHERIRVLEDGKAAPSPAEKQDAP